MSVKLLCLGPYEVMPPTDGGKEGIHGALAALATKAEVTYAYPAGFAGGALSPGYSAINVRCVPVRFSPRESPALIAASTLRLLPFKFAKHATPEAVKCFVAALASARFDAIVCFHAHTVRLAERILRARAQEAPILLREHNIEYALVESYAQSLRPPLRLAAGVYAWITRREERRIWRRVNAVAFLSDADLAAARASRVRGNFVLAPEGVPLPPIREAAWPGSRAPLLILLNARMPKNVANVRIFFERHWIPVRARGLLPTIPLAVTGVTGIELARLMRVTPGELDALGVRALGFVESLPQVFASSLALVSPTFIGGGMRKKILEAMAHRLPVIATPLDVQTASFYQPNVNILSMSSIEDFVTAVRRLSSGPRFWTSLANAGRSAVEHHADWERFAEAMMGQAVHLVDATRLRLLDERRLMPALR